MNFGATPFNEDAWKGSGTVTGTHTYKKTIRTPGIRQVGDVANSVELKDNEVVVAKNLRVHGIYRVLDATSSQNYHTNEV